MPPIDDNRPDPDALLARVQREEEAAQRGKLRIYFGSSAGVGKTYAMLSAARKLRSEGRDVLIGVVETHGRSETADLLNGSDAPEVLPLAEIAYNGRTLKEFDLNLALARKPALIVVDELAHSNAQGSRHAKRWQDVEELLEAGIDVFTALNVQHLESLNDVVGGITGIKVHETVPDTFFDSADEVILVDIPADELLKRLHAGKVYIPEQAQRAANNFFRKGNLIALREIALRRTADRVEDDVQEYREEQSIKKLWQTDSSLLCCIGPDAGSERVVRSAARLAQQIDVGWHAVYVETPRLQRLPEAERERILRTVKLAQELGATTAILSGDHPAEAIVEYARANNVSRIVAGRQQQRAYLHRWPWNPHLATRIARLVPEVDLIAIGFSREQNAEPGHPTQRMATVDTDRSESNEAKSLLRRMPYVWGALACALTTLISTPLLHVLELTNIAMLFVLTVALVAMRWGRNPALLAALLSVASYDFFFVPPRFTFAVSDTHYLLTFFVLFAVAFIIGQLTANLRYQVRVASYREERAQSLYAFSRELSSALRSEDVVEISTRFIGNAFRAEVHVLLPGEREQLIVPEELKRQPEFEPAIAQWAQAQNKPAGAGTDTLSGSPWLCLPLKAPMRIRGVLALRPSRKRLLMVPEQLRQLDTFALLVAIALERVHYVEIAQQTQVSMESERLRNSLLSALSHDLRTPLAALAGLSDMLVMKADTTVEQKDLAESIRNEAQRMNAMVTNLLDMARIQSGNIELNKQWQPIEEVIGSALHACGHSLSAHKVEVAPMSHLPLIEIDAVLIERVLVNLLENAAKYTPPGSVVRIEAEVVGKELEVSVQDTGPGLPSRFISGQEDLLFDKFTRGEKESAVPGIGLGLAICRAIVEAHQGRIGVDSSYRKGARFVFSLPLGQPPVVTLE